MKKLLFLSALAIMSFAFVGCTTNNEGTTATKPPVESPTTSPTTTPTTSPTASPTDNATNGVVNDTNGIVNDGNTTAPVK